ncbi:MAG: DUF4124 domain-containing protein [Gammaproteobacteria bacterium]|nr:DUF4124 domain-containing protein [Gammaproteobacteria bacterium]MDH4315607.1 DUF4124 domain-containing protein [Gammaproteobacteria bacterium]MDH5214836.1 DUF4124 domain-containing protein [Gammaproteobacteria bacterium]MDH5499494.1 DUF4124 domain-containing protein [Gammaproteobacteria bacterium]
MYKRPLIAILVLLLAGSVFAQAYRWVDKDGVVHYSDRPEPGAEQVQLPTTRPSSGPSTPAPTSNFSRRNDVPLAEEQAPFSYQSLSIASPASEQTLWNIEGVLSVSLSLQPGLQSGHRVRVYFDGTPQMVTGTSFQIEGVYRGQHNLQAEVIDQSGKLMIRSDPSRFYVQQNAIGN